VFFKKNQQTGYKCLWMHHT